VIELGRDGAAAVEAAMAEERALVHVRFDRGCRCFAARVGEGVVGYGWVSAGPEWIGELGLEFRPPPMEAYLWNCVILPQHRYQGYFRALLCAVVNAAAEEGLKRLWIGSVDSGVESALVGEGFRPVLHIKVLTAFGWSRLGVRPAPGATRETIEVALSSLDGAAGLGSGLRRFRRRVH
jgi:GNAT superfamily N-acetyltransferase